ncbi:amino acid adenylation domain-containing protein [Planktothrix pseudagardhii]|uniref:Linear gramicidin synthase subunit D n=1 Tax=Planktothrix pseudagardhii TaxID=132604 RepID=A0A9W4G7K1_9CYAN|nr:amino acid adenylation domain-containing protein [Planktothrix pseudagardhii]CAD5954744.1 Linear gramicidin synthase subunit D [Planktothrix pseudagardhii]
MNLKQFVAELALAGVKLWVEDDQLRVRAPKKVLTPEVRNLLALHKAELVKLLQNSNAIANDTDLPLLRVSRTGNLPLSFAQEGLWFLSQLEPTNPFYNVPLALRLNGSLNVVALEKSLNKIIQRHEVLRTNFTTVEGQPVQVIALGLTLSVQVIDLSELPESEREIAWGLKARAQIQQPFDLSSSGLIQASVLKLTPTEHILLLTIHHIVWDAPSEGVLVKELAAFYTAYCNDLLPELPELPIQYADFAVWQRQWLQEDILESQLAYWKQQLSGAPEILELPTDRVRKATQTFRGACHRQALSKELTEALMILSQRKGVTLFMTLLAALFTLLYRYTEQTDICVGTPYAGRERRELQGLIGLFLNTLVLRTDISGNPSFEELLSRVRDVALGAYAHHDLPFEKLLEQLQPARNLSYTPYFQVRFVLYPAMQIDMEGLTVSPVAVETATAKLDLFVAFVNSDSGLIGTWEYNTDLFDASTINRMAQHFQTLLEGIVANPQQKVSELPLLTEPERHQLLVEWNNATKEYPFNKCIHQLFEEQVERSPDAIAVVFEGEQLTYQDLNQRANRIAHHLKTLGVEPEVLVGIYVDRSLEMVVSLLGILKTGGAYVPLDPSYPKERLAFMLQNSQPKVLLTQECLITELPEHTAQVVCLDTDRHLIAQHSEENLNQTATVANLAYVIYTSGSTGKPKGVQVTHANLCHYAQAMSQVLNITAEDVYLHTASIAFSSSVRQLIVPLASGATVKIATSEQRKDPQSLFTTIKQHSVTVIDIVPSYWRNCIHTLASLEPVTKQALLDNKLRLIVSASEPLLSDLPTQWTFGFQHKARLINMFGQTETCGIVATYPIPAQQDEPIKIVPIGRPITNTQIYLLDCHLQPVPVGVPGEVHIGGFGLARGYLNSPELTKEKFIPNPFSQEEGTRLYKTGDNARYLPDGNIEFLGRLDRQVKIRGFRIELGEIEAALAQHPEVRETVVLARDDQPDNKRLVAYVVPNHEPPATIELRHFLQQKLPDYMVPGAFVMLSSLPLTPNGKVDRRALETPDTELSNSMGFVPPRDTVEQQLQQIWSEVLKLPTVGMKDNFFTFGGHSLLAVLLMAQISRHFGKNLPIATLFSSPTIEQLASCLRSETHSLPWSPLVAIQSGTEKRPFFFVPGVGGNVIYLYELARHLGSEQPFYGLQARGLDGESEPFTQLEEIATYYIEAIQTVQPSGPYLLGGHSFGGVVAFEMATQLLKQGHEVALLAIIDVVAPIVANKPNYSDEDEVAYLFDFASYIEYMFSLKLEVSKETLASLSQEEQLNYLKERLIRVNLLPPDAGIGLVRGLVQVYIASLKAHRAYLPSGLQQAPITLFRSSEVDVFEGDTEELKQRRKEPALGWNEFSSTIDIHVVPGNHSTMMQQPHVQVLATQLLSCLKQTQAPLA